MIFSRKNQKSKASNKPEHSSTERRNNREAQLERPEFAFFFLFRGDDLVIISAPTRDVDEFLFPVKDDLTSSIEVNPLCHFEKCSPISLDVSDLLGQTNSVFNVVKPVRSTLSLDKFIEFTRQFVREDEQLEKSELLHGGRTLLYLMEKDNIKYKKRTWEEYIRLLLEPDISSRETEVEQ
jgi:hypothetical protein